VLLPRGSVVGNGSHKLGRQTALEPQSLFTYIVDCKNSPVVACCGKEGENPYKQAGVLQARRAGMGVHVESCYVEQERVHRDGSLPGLQHLEGIVGDSG
jgi:hypothetical protein